MDDGNQWDLGTYGAPYASEASELDRCLDNHHAVDTSGSAPLPGTCGSCGFLVYEPAESIWWHLPAHTSALGSGPGSTAIETGAPVRTPSVPSTPTRLPLGPCCGTPPEVAADRIRTARSSS
jgi:hypothetical protein